jgi:hypothetical protein
MSKPDVLDRVSADLALGHTQLAIQRLSSLVARHPTDLDLRRQLARLHRMVGNRIEAGRWDYLTPGADAAEVTAFERAFPSPSRRLAALRWPHWYELLGGGAADVPGQPAGTSPRSRPSDFGQAVTGYARARLESLARAAKAEVTGPAAAEPTRPAAAEVTRPAAAEPTRPAAAEVTGPAAARPGSARIGRPPRAMLAAALAAIGVLATFFVVLGAVTVAQWLLR